MRKDVNRGFTIVELLVVIVVIGILAAISFVSYSGISSKAIVASLQSDLNNNAKILKLYNVEYGYYPSSINSTSYCPETPNIDSRYCLKASSGTTLTYTGSGQSFMVRAVKNSISWVITENSVAYAASVPTVISNTATSITSTTATLGANVTSDGGSDLTEIGTCWGLTANPTTNCVSLELGTLTALSPATVATETYPTGLAISPDDKFVYATNRDSNTVSMYSRDVITGSLTALATPTVPTLTAPYDIIISPDGKSAYVINRTGSGSIYMYSRDVSTGLLTALTPATIAAGTDTRNIAISPDGKSVYVADYYSISSKGYISMFNRDTSTGLLTAQATPTIQSGGRYTYGITVSPDGSSVYAVNNVAPYGNTSIYNRNPIDGSLSSAGATIEQAGGVSNAMFSPNGDNVYIGGASDIFLYNRNTSTGELTAFATPSINSPAAYMIISPDGKSVYTANSTQITAFSRNIVDGSLTKLTSPYTTVSANIYDMHISSDGKSVYTSRSNSNTLIMFSRYDKFSLGVFTQARTGLTTKTTYYYRGYAKNSVGTGYAPDSTFVTP